MGWFSHCDVSAVSSKHAPSSDVGATTQRNRSPPLMKFWKSWNTQRSPNLNSEPNPLLVALVISSEIPWIFGISECLILFYHITGILAIAWTKLRIIPAKLQDFRYVICHLHFPSLRPSLHVLHCNVSLFKVPIFPKKFGKLKLFHFLFNGREHAFISLKGPLTLLNQIPIFISVPQIDSAGRFVRGIYWPYRYYP